MNSANFKFSYDNKKNIFFRKNEIKHEIDREVWIECMTVKDEKQMGWAKFLNTEKLIKYKK